MRSVRRVAAPEICPVCGAEVPDGASVCPGCGADETSGWSDRARYDSLDLPDDAFDYDEFVRRELRGETPRRPGQRFWWVVAVGITLALLWLVVRGWR
jgi:hypothetical protein